MGWFRRLFRGDSADDESAEAREYDHPDSGEEALREHPAPSLFGGVEMDPDAAYEPPEEPGQ